ncbi:hypothetical protein AB0L40_00625 [Patulibacter sp. NPDC049589]|uniref:hypothetical protein n=1 Tax=Patulibacter sp. NPDC049589 TaxID=3154731 RepID=UPI0034136D88
MASFKGRDIVLRASKGTDDCNGRGSIAINQDIKYDFVPGQPDSVTDTYADLTQIPRIILLADCDIVIGAGVTRIDAWLVAGRNLITCDTKNTSAGKTPTAARNVQALTIADCAQPLTVNGPTFANKLYPLRTTGADLTASDVTTPAETFNLPRDQMLTNYVHNRSNASYVPVRETEVPPSY